MSEQWSIILTSAVVAAAVSGLLSLLGVVLNLAVTGARADKRRKRETFARALAAAVAYAEFPYVVRRRRASDREGERIRISEELRRVQEDLAYYGAWIQNESAAVSTSYQELLTKTREIAGPKISEAWDVEPIRKDKEMHMPDLGLSRLKPVQDEYVEAVSKHLTPWWKRFSPWKSELAGL